MLNFALHQMTSDDLHSFLQKGALIGLDQSHLIVGWGEPLQGKSPQPSAPAFFAPDFYLEDSQPWISFPSYALVARDTFLELLRKLNVPEGSPWNWEDPKKQYFEKSFELIQNEIAKNKIVKAVPVVFARAKTTVTAPSRARLLIDLLESAKVTRPYGFWVENEGMLGATPEVLFELNGAENILETMALAGTRSSERNVSEPIATDEKELYEHQLVVDGLKEKLNSFGEIQVAPTETWDLGSLCHLRTDMRVTLAEGIETAELFTKAASTLHPTPALGVAPSSADWKWLKNCDGNMNRRRFGAPFGFLNPDGKSVCLVSIRNIQWSNYYAVLGTGCGIVAASQLENEWQELALKRKFVKEILKI